MVKTVSIAALAFAMILTVGNVASFAQFSGRGGLGGIFGGRAVVAAMGEIDKIKTAIWIAWCRIRMSRLSITS